MDSRDSSIIIGIRRKFANKSDEWNTFISLVDFNKYKLQATRKKPIMEQSLYKFLHAITKLVMLDL